MKLKSNLPFLILFYFVCIQFCCPLIQVESQETYEIPHYEVRFSITVLDMDLSDLTATISIAVGINEFPVEADKVIITMVGLVGKSGLLDIPCEKQGPGVFLGEIENVEWILYGYGEMFPHDSYNLTFSIYKNSVYEMNESTFYFDSNWDYDISMDSGGTFLPPKGRLLKGHWVCSPGWILPELMTEHEYTIILIRKHLAPYLLFLVPLLLGESLMLITLFLNHRYEFIGIYAALIAFSPLSIISIRSYLPHRETMCLIEFYSLFMFMTSIALITRTILLKESYPPFKKDKFNNIYLLIIDMIFIISLTFSHHYLILTIYNHIKTQVMKTAALSINTFNLLFLLIIAGRFVIFIADEKFMNTLKSKILDIKTKIIYKNDQNKSLE